MAVKQKVPAERKEGNAVVREFMVGGKRVSFEGRLHRNGGGFVASTACAADTAFIGPEAAVLEKARVLGAAALKDAAMAMGNSVVRDDAVAGGHATILGNAQIYEEARVRGWGVFKGGTRVYGKADLDGSITYSGETRIHGEIRALPSASGVIKDAEFSGDYAIDGSIYAKDGKYSWHVLKVDGKETRLFGRNHGNGGGFVGIWALVGESVYVGPKAAVIKGNVVGKTRIEDRAVVHDGSISGSGNGVVIKGDAQVYGGNVREEARIAGNAHLVEGTLAGKFVLEGDAVFMYKDEVANVGRLRTGRVLDRCSFGTYVDLYMY